MASKHCWMTTAPEQHQKPQLPPPPPRQNGRGANSGAPPPPLRQLERVHRQQLLRQRLQQLLHLAPLRLLLHGLVLDI